MTSVVAPAREFEAGPIRPYGDENDAAVTVGSRRAGTPPRRRGLESDEGRRQSGASRRSDRGAVSSWPG